LYEQPVGRELAKTVILIFVGMAAAPIVLVGVTEYMALAVAAVGVPVMAQVVGERFRPAGSGGATVQAYDVGTEVPVHLNKFPPPVV